MKRIAIMLIMSALIALSLCACQGSGTATQTSSAAAPSAVSSETVAQDDADNTTPTVTKTPQTNCPFEGTWAPIGVMFRGELKSFDAAPTLRDLYDTTFITFTADGRFAYQSHMTIYRGTWILFNKSDGIRTYKLATDSVSHIDLESGLGGKEAESKTKPVFLAMYYAESDEAHFLIYKKGDDIEETPTPVFAQTASYEVPLEPSGGSDDNPQETPQPQSSSSSVAGPDGASSSSSAKRETSSSSTASTESDDGHLQLSDEFETPDGRGFMGSDGNYYFQNDDGSYEVTDGYGTGIRDVDGDGSGDYYTIDGGETWHEMP